MKKGQFCLCLRTLREFGSWENNLYNCGIDLEGTPAADLASLVHTLMCDCDPDWAYDTKLSIDWIIEWACGESDIYHQKRHGREWDLTEAGILYEFIEFMNEYGWEDE